MSQTASKRTSQQVNPIAAGVIIFLVLAAGGYATYFFVWKGSRGSSVEFKEPVDARGGGRTFANNGNNGSGGNGRNGRNNNGGGNNGGGNNANVGFAEFSRDSILKRITGSVMIRKGDVQIQAVPNLAGGHNYYVEYDYSTKAAWLTDEHKSLVALVGKVADRDVLAKYVEATDEQLKQIKAILSAKEELTSAESDKLEPLVAEWEKTSQSERTAIAKRIFDASEQIAGAHLASGKAQAVARVEKLAAILSAEQIEKARNWPPKTAGRSTTRPVI